jgi:chromatin remodeling complex protein RSC6
MPSKSTSSKSKSSTDTPTVAPTAETVVKTAAAPKKKSSGKKPAATATPAATPAKKSSGKKQTVSAAKVSDAVAAAPKQTEPTPSADASAVAAAAAPITVAADTDNGWDNIESQFTSIATRLADFKTLYSKLVTDMKTLHKDVQKTLRESTRKNRRKNRIHVVTDPNAPPRAPSGFAKPTIISNQLCSFLGCENGTEMARTEVTKHLTTYIKQNKLQNEADKRTIQPDAKLQGLLNVPTGEALTYFNLQKYMKVHFPQSAASLAAAAAATASA